MEDSPILRPLTAEESQELFANYLRPPKPSESAMATIRLASAIGETRPVFRLPSPGPLPPPREPTEGDRETIRLDSALGTDSKLVPKGTGWRPRPASLAEGLALHQAYLRKHQQIKESESDMAGLQPASATGMLKRSGHSDDKRVDTETLSETGTDTEKTATEELAESQDIAESQSTTDSLSSIATEYLLDPDTLPQTQVIEYCGKGEDFNPETGPSKATSTTDQANKAWKCPRGHPCGHYFMRHDKQTCPGCGWSRGSKKAAQPEFVDWTFPDTYPFAMKRENVDWKWQNRTKPANEVKTHNAAANVLWDIMTRKNFDDDEKRERIREPFEFETTDYALLMRDVLRAKERE